MRSESRSAPVAGKHGWNRRELIAAGAGVSLGVGAALGQTPQFRPRRAKRVVVVGAGAFGGWSALELCRRGYEVTLVDAWGPGNSRASSGGDTRVIRGMYGPDRLYTEWAVRAMELWLDAERRWGQRLFTPTGALWMFRGDDGYARAGVATLADAGWGARELTVAAAAASYPQISFDGVRSVFVEDRAGYLVARRCCQRVAQALVEAGGRELRAEATPGAIEGGSLRAVTLAGGATLEADHFVFACGPWLGRVFPEVIGTRIRPTRQEVFYFGPPAAEAERFSEARLPTWIDFGERVMYGIPGNEFRGFKVADDTHGETVDPTTLERVASAGALERARDLLRHRFPALAAAPVLESRVCQYENTADGHYLIDRHPEAANVWLVGGGSGHGFKMGPALGEHVADLVTGKAEPLSRFALARLAAAPTGERSQLRSGEGT